MQSTTLSEEDVLWCYRAILGRPPESATAIRAHLSTSKDFRSLVLRFISCQEFQDKMSIPATMVPLDRAEMDIDLTASTAELPLVLDRIREAWTHLGEVRPHFSVLTQQKFLPGSMNAELIKRFYASGVSEVSVIATMLRRYGFSDPESKICVEYGCGLGRVTLPLAKMFKAVHGYDISANHLALAEDRAAETGMHNIEFHLCSSEVIVEQLERCDFFYSRIVFQHNPPPIIRELIGAALDSLRAGGIAIFQVPTYSQGYSFRVKDYLAQPSTFGIEMHCIPQH